MVIDELHQAPSAVELRLAQNTPTPCARSHLCASAHAPRAPTPSRAGVPRSSGLGGARHRARPAGPTSGAFRPCTPACPQSTRLAAHSDGCSAPCSRTSRTARSRTSGEYRLSRDMAPSSQGKSPPTNPSTVHFRLGRVGREPAFGMQERMHRSIVASWGRWRSGCGTRSRRIGTRGSRSPLPCEPKGTHECSKSYDTVEGYRLGSWCGNRA